MAYSGGGIDRRDGGDVTATSLSGAAISCANTSATPWPVTRRTTALGIGPQVTG